MSLFRLIYNTMKHLKLFEELKNYKNLKPYHPYGSKTIQISKIELQDICKKLELDENQIKFITSGSFGNAYEYGEQVLKITTDKREAEMAWNLIGVDNPGIVRYYGVWRYKIKSKIRYIILMDKVEPVLNYIKKNIKDEASAKGILYDACDAIFQNWGEISREQYLEEIEQKWNLGTGFYKQLVNKLWNCYSNLKKFTLCDFHEHNVGVIGNRVVLFDVTELRKRVRKFDIPELL